MLRALTVDEVAPADRISTPSDSEVATRLSANIANNLRRHMAHRMGMPAPEKPLKGSGHFLPQRWIDEAMV